MGSPDVGEIDWRIFLSTRNFLLEQGLVVQIDEATCFDIRSAAGRAGKIEFVQGSATLSI